MTSRDFAYWFQGYIELSHVSSLDPEQFEIVKKHLALVFQHEIDPSYKSPVPGVTDKQHQTELNKTHWERPCPSDIKVRC